MKVTYGPKPDIIRAVERGDLSVVKYYVESAASISDAEKRKVINQARLVSEVDDYGSGNYAYGNQCYDLTPLTTAAMNGYHDIVKYLLQQGADPTLQGCHIEKASADGYTESNMCMALHETFVFSMMH